MKRTAFWWSGVGLLIAAVVVACGGDDDPEPATLVLRGGQVHTMDAERSVTTAVAVRGNRIVAVGSDVAVNRYVGAQTEVVELRGRMLLPGFIDTHIHSVEGSLELGKCSMDDRPLSPAQIRVAVQACLATEPAAAADAWFEVVNVNPAGLVMNAADLDSMLSARPLLLRGSDHHTAWANTRGMQLAGITAATPDPAGGSIERDALGRPNGFFKDPPAIDLVAAAMPALTLAQRVAKEKIAQAQHNAFGITSIQDALVTPEVLRVYESLESSRELSLRVRATLASSVTDDEAEFTRLKALRTQYASGHPLLRADAVKVFADGVIEYPTQTAALLKPYLDGQGRPTTNRGGNYVDPQQLNRYVRRLDAEGFTVHVHAIGDATTRAALDAFTFARQANGATDHRHQIAHLQLVDPADFARFAPLGVLANMQLLWAIPDVYTIDAVQPYIDATSFQYMYPAGSLRAAGATLVGSSDWPVSTENPLLAIATGVLRANPETGLVLNAAQRVTLADMLAAYTIHAARALKQDDRTGSIEVGKLADLVVIDRDLTRIPTEQIAEAIVQLTLFDGRRVHESTGPAPAATRRGAQAIGRGAWRGSEVHAHAAPDAASSPQAAVSSARHAQDR